MERLVLRFVYALERSGCSLSRSAGWHARSMGVRATLRAALAAGALATVQWVGAAKGTVIVSDGTALLAACGDFVAYVERGATDATEDNVINAAVCTAFIRGVTEGVAMASSEPGLGSGYCLPGGTLPALQSARVVVKWLREHPAKLHLVPGPLVVASFRDAFPCRK